PLNFWEVYKWIEPAWKPFASNRVLNISCTSIRSFRNTNMPAMKPACTVLLISILFTAQIRAQCWKQVSAGNGYSLAIKTDGTLWGWGGNNHGQLGNGTTVSQNVPVQIGGANDWKQVAASFGHSVAIKTGGTLWAWGENSHGELGDGTNTDRYLPVQIGSAAN